MDKAFLSKFMQGRRKQEDIVKVFVGGEKNPNQQMGTTRDVKEISLGKRKMISDKNLNTYK